jgi:SAM-dependent methyltransferase
LQATRRLSSGKSNVMADVAMTWEQSVQWLRDQPGQQDLVKACFFDDPIEVAAERYRRSSEWRAVQAFLPPSPARVLDVGAGRGIAAYAFAAEGFDVTALEPDPSDLVGAGCIRLLSERTGLSIEVAEARAEDLPFATASFDIVHCRQALHHATDLRQMCRELGRVLKDGGLFIATREHVISKPDDLEAFLDGHPLHRFYEGENAYRLDEYRSAIEGGGINIETTLNPFETDINRFPETLEAIKRRIAARVHWPLPMLVPAALVRSMGDRDQTPGRLYSFVGRRSVRTGDR